MGEVRNSRSNDAAERIIQAARKLFFQHGVNGVTTDMLAKNAGVSKSTIYKHFPDKKAILKATVHEESKRIYDMEKPLPKSKKAYDQLLCDFGKGFINLLMDPEILRCDQLIISQAIKSPEMSSFFFSRCCVEVYDQMEKIIAYGQEKGFLASKHNAEKLADVLISSWEGKAHMSALYGVKDVSYGDIEKHVRDVMEIILGI